MTQQTFDLDTGLGDKETLTRLKGKLIFRLSLSSQATRLPLNDLWSGKEVAGIRVSLTGIDRGMFPAAGKQKVIKLPFDLKPVYVEL